MNKGQNIAGPGTKFYNPDIKNETQGIYPYSNYVNNNSNMSLSFWL